MNAMSIRSSWFAMLLAGLGLVAGDALAATSTGSSSWSAYAVSGTDLLQTQLGSIVDELAVNTFENNSWSFGTTATLTDGTSGDANASQSLALSGGAVTYILNTALSPTGYDITSVDTYSGWRDVGRINQHLEVSFRKVGSSTFGDAVTVDYPGGASQTRVNIADINLTGVDAVRFTFLDQQNGGVGYKELDVFGHPSAPASTVTSESSGSVYTVSGTDLLQSHLGSTDNAISLYAEGGYANGGAAVLTDGSFGDASKADSCGITGGSVTYMLDTATHPAGYAVTAIDTYTGWNDGGRDNQNYTVSFRKVGSSLFSVPITVAYVAPGSTSFSGTHVNIAGLNLTGVDAVRFTFTAQENSGVGYKELDVIGSAPAYDDVTRRDSGSQVITSNDVSNVRIIEGTGTPGVNTLGAAMTVIGTLTQSATDGLATIDPAGQTLALNGIYLGSAAGGLAIGTGSNNGTLKSAGAALLVDNVSANGITVNSVIANGTGASTLTKLGSGTLTLNAANTYSGGTTVSAGTLRIAGGTLGTGAVSVNGGNLQIDGGTVAPASSGGLLFANGTVNQTAGSLSFSGYARVSDETLNLSGGTSGIDPENLLGWTGANVTVNISGSHVADWRVTRFVGGTATVNLQSGGSLYCDQLYSAGATGVLVFDGGRLGMSSREPGRSPGDWISTSSGSLSLYVKNGGAIIDTANGGATINRPFLRDGASTGGLTKTGANTLTLSGSSTEFLSTYVGDTLVQGGTLKLSQLPVFMPVIVNAGFEQPTQVAGGWSALSSDGVPGGWGWVFSDPNSTDKGGIAVNNSPWVSTAPQGIQAGFIQGSCTLVQTLAVPAAGVYRLSFSAANRPGHVGDNLEVQIGGVTVGFWSADAFNNGGAFKSYTATVTLSPGSHELKFVGTSPGGDTATTIDDVKLLRTDGDLPGSLPVGTRLAVSAGAVVDLNGASQTVASLSGSGRVVNSSTTNVAFTFGSDNASTNFSGIVEGPVSLVKAGTGKMTFSGLYYTGATTINGGALVLDFPSIGTAAYAMANAYSFSPAVGNLLAGLSPTDVSNSGAGQESTGPVTKLTDGVVDANYANTYTIGNNAVLTYKVGTETQGYKITQINIYAGWVNSDREDITLADISYSTVDAPDTFIPIANSDVNYDGGTPNARVALTAGGGLLAANVYAIRFNFGIQENGYVGYRELEVIGTRSCLPTNTVVAVAVGAVLDLNGHTQSVAGLNGSGLVTNGTLAVSGVIAPGGTNMIGTLTLAATTSLSGTLLMDAAMGGTCDLLRVQGGLDLSGLALVIQDVGQMGGGSPYVIATCAPGGLTGRFTSTNLDSKRMVYYNNAAGEVQLVGRGLLIMLK